MKAWVPFAYCRCVFAMPAPVPAVGRVALLTTAGHVTFAGVPASALVAMLTSPATPLRNCAGSLGPGGCAAMTPC